MSLLSKSRLLVGLLALYAARAAAPGLPGELEALLDELRVPHSHVGLYVESLDDGEVIASSNADKPFNPASVINLLPSLAALEMLTPAYQWSTSVYAARLPRNGVLDGDLYIRSGGDPYLTKAVSTPAMTGASSLRIMVWKAA